LIYIFSCRAILPGFSPKILGTKSEKTMTTTTEKTTINTEKTTTNTGENPNLAAIKKAVEAKKAAASKRRAPVPAPKKRGITSPAPKPVDQKTETEKAAYAAKIAATKKRTRELLAAIMQTAPISNPVKSVAGFTGRDKPLPKAPYGTERPAYTDRAVAAICVAIAANGKKLQSGITFNRRFPIGDADKYDTAMIESGVYRRALTGSSAYSGKPFSATGKAGNEKIKMPTGNAFAALRKHAVSRFGEKALKKANII
jgi:hypothetical protein